MAIRDEIKTALQHIEDASCLLGLVAESAGEQVVVWDRLFAGDKAALEMAECLLPRDPADLDATQVGRIRRVARHAAEQAAGVVEGFRSGRLAVPAGDESLATPHLQALGATFPPPAPDEVWVRESSVSRGHP